MKKVKTVRAYLICFVSLPRTEFLRSRVHNNVRHSYESADNTETSSSFRRALRTLFRPCTRPVKNRIGPHTRVYTHTGVCGDGERRPWYTYIYVP